LCSPPHRGLAQSGRFRHTGMVSIIIHLLSLWAESHDMFFSLSLIVPHRFFSCSSLFLIYVFLFALLLWCPWSYLVFFYPLT
jgi:hypothetical protein